MAVDAAGDIVAPVDVGAAEVAVFAACVVSDLHVVAAALPLVWSLYHPRELLRQKSIVLRLKRAEASNVSDLESVHLQ